MQEGVKKLDKRKVRHHAVTSAVEVKWKGVVFGSLI